MKNYIEHKIKLPLLKRVAKLLIHKNDDKKYNIYRNNEKFEEGFTIITTEKKY